MFNWKKPRGNGDLESEIDTSALSSNSRGRGSNSTQPIPSGSVSQTGGVLSTSPIPSRSQRGRSTTNTTTGVPRSGAMLPYSVRQDPGYFDRNEFTAAGDLSMCMPEPERDEEDPEDAQQRVSGSYQNSSTTSKSLSTSEAGVDRTAKEQTRLTSGGGVSAVGTSTQEGLFDRILGPKGTLRPGL